jgi:hypothetical protein
MESKSKEEEMESETQFNSSTLKYCQIKCIENSLYSVSISTEFEKDCQNSN